MRAAILVGVLIPVLNGMGAPSDTEGGDSFARYQVILDRAPFGAAQAPPPAAVPELSASMAQSLRLTSLMEDNESAYAGIIDAETGRSFFLRVGEMEEGWELVSVNLSGEEAVVRKGVETATLNMSDAPRPSAPATARSGEAATAGGLAARRPAWAQRIRRAAEDGSDPEGRRPRPSREEMEARLRAYQEEVTREGLPPLPVPLVPER